MLRIRYANRKSVFFYSIRREDVDEMVGQHAAHWRQETIDRPDGTTETRRIDPATLIVEWQEGESWQEGKPFEVLAIPGVGAAPAAV